MGMDARYEAWAVSAEGLTDAIARLRDAEMLGMNVTVPHKQAVMPLLDEVDADARAIGAVNCISKVDGRLVGHNTDRYGFIRSLREAGCEPRGLDVLILGAGGSARAVAHGLLETEAASVTVAGRTRAHVDTLLDELRASFPNAMLSGAGWQVEALNTVCRSAGLIVNCTPIGMRSGLSAGESPLAASQIPASAWVYDLVYNPQETPLLAEAQKAGAKPIGGLEMLIYQAVESVRLWTGREAPVEVMRKAARDALEE
jgi:shikimate dehydrogenase